jgi:uncharacterized protein YjdB
MRTAITATLSLLLLQACNAPTSIEVEPKRPLITAKGQSLQLQTKVKDKEGKVMSGVSVVYRSLTPTMASVDSLGKVTAVTSGTATILVEAGKASRQVEVLIQIPKKIVIQPGDRLLMMGVTKRYRGTVYDDRDKAMIVGKIRWSSSDPEIFTVDEHGDLKTLKEGTAKLTAHAAGISASEDITVKHEEVHEDGTISQ